MEDETTVYNISGSYSVRIPARMAKYFNLKSKTKVTIEDKSRNEAIIKF